MQKARGESAAATRQRIVEATFELHRSRGIAATSFRDIAEEAGVAVGSVYHHFGDYDEVIRACSAHARALMRPPTISIFDGIRSPRRRLQHLVREIFRFYERFPEHERIRSERDRFPLIDQSMRQIESLRRQLIAAAVHPRRLGKRTAAAVFALLDPAVYSALTASGLTTAHAAEEVFRILDHIIYRRAQSR